MNVKDIRRENMRALARSIGGVSAIAQRLGKSQGQISHLIGTTPIKNIGDRIASEVEKEFKKPPGWLDKAHPEINETAAYYDVYHTVPLIDWTLISSWQEQTYYQKENVIRWVGSSVRRMGEKSFAVSVRDDSMEQASGMSFPKDSIIIVDPESVAKNGRFVIACAKDGSPTFKQLVIDGHQQYLKPLNPRYPIIELSHHYQIQGVVLQMLVLFEEN